MIKHNESLTDEFDIHSFFRVLNQNKTKIWLWQRDDTRRIVQYAMVRKVDLIKKVIHISPCSSKGFKFKTIQDFFFYNAENSKAFKFTARDLSRDMIIFPIPKAIQTVTKEFLKDVELVEKENEDKFKHLRNTPRVQPNSKQTVSIKRINIHSDFTHQEKYTLYDISSGGMGIQVDDPSEFDIGEFIEVLMINSKTVPKSMSGEIVSIKQNDNKSEGFKVGVKFSN
ncbi:PilZ domain-containing protein [Halobacteriovorax sp.]|uniref:PilZ domain-containing protein n=1 Tax=Halobacteriovorax sp. TaxID=2020862 RepID=UPI00356AD5F4